MKKTYIFLLVLILPFVSFADNFPVGANSSGMAYSTVAVPNLWSIYSNQAGLAHLDGYNFGVHYNNTFGMKEFGVKSTAFAMSSKAGAFGLTYTNYGFSEFYENKLGLAYALKLSKILSIGFQMDYFMMQQSAYYGNINTVAGEIGLLAKPNEKMYIGVHVFNPWRAEISEYESERMPTIFRLGMGYQFTEKLLFTIETEKDLELKPTFKTGVDYNLVSQLYLRGGMQITGKDYAYAFGTGYKFKGVSLDLSVNKHPVLDYNTAVSLHVNLGKKNK